MPSWVDFKDIKARVSIRDILAHYQVTNLREKGRELIGPCPVHGGDNPRAFHADTVRNIWNCFTRCRGGGNVLDFVARKEGVDIREAALLVQDWFGADSTETKPTTAHVEARPEPTDDPLKANPVLDLKLTLKPDVPCLLRDRGLTLETVINFGIGYCSKGTLRGHIAIPIRNDHGDLVAYAGRRISGDGPKYKFPSGFKKQFVLFNFDRATEYLEKGLIAVEGFFSVFWLHQAGYSNAVALMGSTASPYQIELLTRAKRVTLLFDGDEAGQVCTEECVERLRGRTALIVKHLGPGQQPDGLTVATLQQFLRP